MHSWWFLYRTASGGVIQVTVQAPDGYSANQIARAQYGFRNSDGSGLISESANKVN
jgi:hypothetical protein